ncbi:methyltransferase domain-containing protein [Kitasatospora acidiphila]|uniref:Methyltransferase domain-containing protein n=1 Tax=Kitasatospora acidiphila TaxID=2567942 RepID=A0A540VXM0_9ACTN|nr:methyltransferase domain-containing protein [Kitasatospora acidiphila]TQF01503.1 methyltransferase domain-containing protein [Kitasatospora acidiphila]
MTTVRLDARPDSPRRHRGSLGDGLLFLAEALRSWHDTGAVAPSGADLVNALLVPVTSRPDRPLSVLEVGAGTGVVTRRLVLALRPGDRLHVVEANARFVQHLREDPVLVRHGPSVGLRLSAGRAEDLMDYQDELGRYDVIVSGLPFTNFPPVQVRQLLDLYLRLLAPGGELTYFRYRGTTALRALTSGPRRAAQHRAVVHLLRQFEESYGLGERTAWRNVPPARACLARKPG